MTNNQNQPRKFDAVLGGETPPPLQGVVLGGMEGVKRRLSSGNTEAQIAGLSEALNHGDAGLDLVIAALESKYRKVRHTAVELLQNREENLAKYALKNYKFWSGFEKLYGLPGEYATSFANRKVIEFDPKISITDVSNTAYALRVKRQSYNGDHQDEMSIPEQLQILSKQPLANQIEALVIGFWHTSGSSCYDGPSAVVDTLIDVHEQLPNLKALFLGDIEDKECMISLISQTNLSLILVAYPHLEVLKIRGDGGEYTRVPGLAFDPLQHDKLKALIIESGGLRRQTVNQICNLELPNLQYLELWLGTDRYGGNSTIDDVMPIISGIFPKLKYLGLRNSEYSDYVAFALISLLIV